MISDCLRIELEIVELHCPSMLYDRAAQPRMKCRSQMSSISATTPIGGHARLGALRHLGMAFCEHGYRSS